MAKRRNAHLVGSVPLDNVDAVFRMAAFSLGGYLRRIPDGETGARLGWIRWQCDIFTQHPQFVETEADTNPFAPARKRFALIKEVDLEFPPLGYAKVASESFREFQRLKQEKTIPAEIRFQVSLPTPSNVLRALVAREHIDVVEPAYERALLREVDGLVQTIPSKELAIQWDIPFEVRWWQTAERSGWRGSPFRPWFDNLQEGITARLCRLANHVPSQVELGFHMCFGDYQHLRAAQRPLATMMSAPPNSEAVVDLAGTLLSRTQRPISFLHIPVPRECDPMYFEGLRRLQPPDTPDTDLFLGLIHLTDGLAGSMQRVNHARKVITDFGVATECGWGRRAPESVPGVFALHRAVLEACDD
jgi:hypothetical protein